MSNQDGGAAFPSAEARNANDEIYQYSESGMSLRDFIAAGVCRAMCTSTSNEGFIEFDYKRTDGLTVAQYVAKTSYAMADAMISERDKP